MPRPPKLGAYKIIGVPIEIEYYNILKELSRERGIPMAELVRNIIYKYLEKQGLRKAEVIAKDGGIQTLSKIEQKMLAIELRDLIKELEGYVSKLQSMPKLARKTIEWYDAVSRLDDGIKKALNIMRRLGIPSDNIVKRLNEIIKFREGIEK